MISTVAANNLLFFQVYSSLSMKTIKDVSLTYKRLALERALGRISEFPAVYVPRCSLVL